MMAVLTVLCPAIPASGEQTVTGITKPSGDMTMAFTVSGDVDETGVEEGDLVEKGELLVSLDDSIQQARLASLKFKAESTAQIQAAAAQAEQAEQDHEKMKWAHNKGAATDWELAHARLEKEIARHRLQIKREEKQMAEFERDEMLRQIRFYDLLAPRDSLVEELKIETGECAEALDPVLRLVVIDPLWVEVHLPMKLTNRVSAGDEMTVCFPHKPREKRIGRVVFLAAVGDAASETVRMRVEVANPGMRRAGERVRVVLPDAGSGEQPWDEDQTTGDVSP